MTNWLGMIMLNMLLNYVVSVLAYLKKILLYLPNDVALLYYNAFILPCFSFCTVVWFKYAHSSKQKLIDKIDKIISILDIKKKLKTHEFINSTHVSDVWKIFKLQFVSLM